MPAQHLAMFLKPKKLSHCTNIAAFWNKPINPANKSALVSGKQAGNQKYFNTEEIEYICQTCT
jgi:hypothetical protein